MKKYLTIILVLLIVANGVALLFLYDKRSYADDIELQLESHEEKIKNYELERNNLNEQISILEESIIEDYVELSIHENVVVRNEDLESELTLLKQSNTELEENIKDLKTALYVYKESLILNTSILLIDGKYIEIGESEDNIIKEFGSPSSIEEFTQSDGPFHAGVIFKKASYDEFFIVYISDINGENFRVDLVNTRSNKFSTIQGISVGDSIEKIFEVYPMAQDYYDESSTEIDLLFKVPVSDGITFEIEDGIIIEMHIYVFVP